MPEVDAAFRELRADQPTFRVWRVEQLQLQAVPVEQHGQFHRGDSYIVLQAAEPSGGRRGPLDLHVHFWLGSQTTSDEAGVAAYKTVELDDWLGGAPVQHREVEERESQRFRSYFRAGIRYLEGGVESGFKHVDRTFVPKMYLVKGRRTPVVRQLPTADWEHVNDGDVYVLDTQQHIFVWIGRSANNMEKIHGARLAQSVKDEHGGGVVVIVESGEEDKMCDDEKSAFDEVLPLDKRTVRPAESDKSDETQDRRLAEQITLYRCSDESGSLSVTEVKHGPLFKEDLVSDDSFIVDNGEQGIWVWIGKRASKKERSEGMKNAEEFITIKNYPSHTSVTRVIDEGEPAEFKSLFGKWRDKNSSVGLGRQFSVGTVARMSRDKFDANTLHEDRTLAAQTQMVDDGSGEKQVWRVEKFALVAVEPQDHGKFYGGDSYVVMYKYRAGGREQIIIYFWLGATSGVDEKGTAALKARDLDDELGGTPVQVRVVQGKEPTHFIAMFGGKLIIYSGDKGAEKDCNGCMLHVRGTSKLNARAVQVEYRAKSLNSNDCFVIKLGDNVRVWYGKGSTDEERALAENIADDIADSVEIIEESQESEEFWTCLGGQEPYSNDKRLIEEKAQPARLFQCSNASGAFRADEIYDFDQADLIEDDVMLLDAWHALFLWIGSGSNRVERQESEQLAADFLRTDPAGRDVSTPIIKVKQGCEPPNFTGFFGVWNDDYWAELPSWSTVRAQMTASSPDGNGDVDSNRGDGGVSSVEKSASGTYTLEQLQSSNSNNWPDEVDPCNREQLLASGQFQEVFKMSLDEFNQLPSWKRNGLKKSVGLF